MYQAQRQAGWYHGGDGQETEALLAPMAGLDDGHLPFIDRQFIADVSRGLVHRAEQT